MEASAIFFSILRAELAGESVSEEALSSLTEADFAALYKLSRAQDLAHLIGDGLAKSGVPLSESLSQAFFKQQMLAVYRCEQLRDAYERLCSLFEEKEIDFIPLKGAVIRPYYPEPWMRTSCDIDILIREEDVDRATAAIASSFEGVDKGERNYHDVSFHLNKNVHLELHFNIKENIDSMDRVLSRVWEYSMPREVGTRCYLQSDAFLLFHLVAHNAYHFVKGGCGVRPFLDWWILRRHLCPDEELLSSLLSEAELTDFAHAMDLLSSVWFSDEKQSAMTADMEAYLLGAGIYGSSENKTVIAREKSGGRVRYILERIFMPYDSLKIIYPRLERAPILYPFYTVARWFRGLFRGRGGRAMHELRSAATPENERTQRISRMCRELKLLK